MRNITIFNVKLLISKTINRGLLHDRAFPHNAPSLQNIKIAPDKYDCNKM